MKGPINGEVNVPGRPWGTYSKGILGEDKESNLENKMKKESYELTKKRQQETSDI